MNHSYDCRIRLFMIWTGYVAMGMRKAKQTTTQLCKLSTGKRRIGLFSRPSENCNKSNKCVNLVHVQEIISVNFPRPPERYNKGKSCVCIFSTIPKKNIWLFFFFFFFFSKNVLLKLLELCFINYSALVDETD